MKASPLFLVPLSSSSSSSIVVHQQPRQQRQQQQHLQLKQQHRRGLQVFDDRHSFGVVEDNTPPDIYGDPPLPCQATQYLDGQADPLCNVTEFVCLPPPAAGTAEPDSGDNNNDDNKPVLEAYEITWDYDLFFNASLSLDEAVLPFLEETILTDVATELSLIECARPKQRQRRQLQRYLQEGAAEVVVDDATSWVVGVSSDPEDVVVEALSCTSTLEPTANADSTACVPLQGRLTLFALRPPSIPDGESAITEEQRQAAGDSIREHLKERMDDGAFLVEGAIEQVSYVGVRPTEVPSATPSQAPSQAPAINTLLDVTNPDDTTDEGQQGEDGEDGDEADSNPDDGTQEPGIDGATGNIVGGETQSGDLSVVGRGLISGAAVLTGGVLFLVMLATRKVRPLKDDPHQEAFYGEDEDESIGGNPSGISSTTTQEPMFSVEDNTASLAYRDSLALVAELALVAPSHSIDSSTTTTTSRSHPSNRSGSPPGSFAIASSSDLEQAPSDESSNASSATGATIPNAYSLAYKDSLALVNPYLPRPPAAAATAAAPVRQQQQHRRRGGGGGEDSSSPIPGGRGPVSTILNVLSLASQSAAAISSVLADQEVPSSAVAAAAASASDSHDTEDEEDTSSRANDSYYLEAGRSLSVIDEGDTTTETASKSASFDDTVLHFQEVLSLGSSDSKASARRMLQMT